MIETVFGERSSQLFEINETSITFCQRKATASYKIVEKNVIEIGKIENDGCGFGRLLAALNTTKTYLVYPPRIKTAEVGTNVKFFNE